MLAAGLFVVGCLVALGSLALNWRPASTSSEPDAFDACVMAQHFIEQELLSPSSAKHQPCSDASIREVDTDRWSVVAYVDSDNAFGVSIRTQYWVEMTYTGDGNWHLEALEY
jgi:hypothetical protein